jgi:multiple sugar transport system permease protein
VAVIIAYPVFYTVWMSLQDWFASSLTPPRLVGLANYRKILFGDPRFQVAVVRTLYFTALVIAGETVAGVAMALLFNREFWGRGLLRTLAILPMVATPVAIGLVFVMMYHPTLGVANYLLSVLQLPPFKWTYSSGTALYALAVVDIWQWTPLIMLIALAGLASLPREPYEAAHIDGASSLQAFRHITLPLLANLYLICTLLSTIFLLGDFNTVYFVSGGGPANTTHVLGTLGIRNAFEIAHPRLGVAAVMSALPLVIPLVIVLMRKLRTAEVQL